MIIELCTKSLKEFGITADEYVYLHLVQSGSHDVIEDLKLVVRLEVLQTKGLVKLGEGPDQHIVRDRFSSINSTPVDQMWSELLSWFPLKVYVNGGVRPLRAKDPTASSNNKARKQYKKYINGSVAKHKEVIRCLKVELDQRKKADNLGYMQMLTTWVNQHTWEKYQDLTDTLDNERRITREL
tara:strand:+ start:8336 stop:8884 length:549 start_codon:yes stop_codon:yes gene_type:complete